MAQHCKSNGDSILWRLPEELLVQIFDAAYAPDQTKYMNSREEEHLHSLSEAIEFLQNPVGSFAFVNMPQRRDLNICRRWVRIASKPWLQNRPFKISDQELQLQYLSAPPVLRLLIRKVHISVEHHDLGSSRRASMACSLTDFLQDLFRCSPNIEHLTMDRVEYLFQDHFIDEHIYFRLHTEDETLVELPWVSVLMAQPKLRRINFSNVIFEGRKTQVIYDAEACLNIMLATKGAGSFDLQDWRAVARHFDLIVGWSKESFNGCHITLMILLLGMYQEESEACRYFTMLCRGEHERWRQKWLSAAKS